METKEIYKRKLIIFLKNRNAYDSFIEQLNSRGLHAKGIDDLINCCERYYIHDYYQFSPTAILNDSFLWDESVEGFQYWASLYAKLLECQDDIDIADYELINQPDQWANMWED